MARFEMYEQTAGAAGAVNQAEMLLELGLLCATGRDGRIDVIEAHKWFNIAAIKGNDHAARLRSELAASMTKPQIAQALRQAREWMTLH